MAVTTQNSVEYAAAYINKPTSNLPTTSLHGRVRTAVFTHTQQGAGDNNSSVLLMRLPPGTVRVLLGCSYFYCDWSINAMSLGWGAHTGLDGTTVNQQFNGLVASLNVTTPGLFTGSNFAGAANGPVLANQGFSKLLESKDGVEIRAVANGTIASGVKLNGVLFYVQD